MSVKLRLSRHGKKNYAFYHIIAADSRSPRDGKFLEKIGTYNPNSNPATIEISIDKAVKWLENGAQPTDTCRSILSKSGVLMKMHLLGGVKKGAFTIEEAEVRFEKWLKEKALSNQANNDKIANEETTAKESRLAAELKINSARAAAIAKRIADAQAPVEAPAEEAVVTESAE